MKKTLFLAFLLVFTINYCQLNDGLKAFYSFSGNTNDNSGQGHNGQIIGNLNLVDDRFGTPNSAYQFPGNSSNYIKINYAEDFNISSSESLSISLWYKGGSAQMGDLEILFGKQNLQNNYKPYDYFLGLYDLNSVLSGGNGEVLWSPITPPQNDPNWHFVVFTYQNKNWYLYQDNVLTQSNTSQAYAITQSLNSLVIGKGFQGIIDDVRFYNRKLSESEIDMLYKLNNLATKENSIRLKLFPNPTNKYLNINRETKEPIIVSMYDMTGKIIFSNVFQSKEIIIDLSKFQNGIYNLKTISNGLHNSTLIIKKD